ncbi:MAG: hypothetical protein DMF62_12780 [Acidobacteria bacterium]|nr:MAG: hypothetical protein DMF62_12780 [Acidobacteriota bacterium]
MNTPTPQRSEQLNELADRIEHDTANMPPALSDVKQAARELRHLAEVEAACAAMRQFIKRFSGVQSVHPHPEWYTKQADALLGADNCGADFLAQHRELEATHRKLTEAVQDQMSRAYTLAKENHELRSAYVDLEAKHKVLVEESTLVCNEAAVLCYVLGAFATAIEFTKGEIEKTREALKSTAKPNPPSPTQD